MKNTLMRNRCDLKMFDLSTTGPARRCLWHDKSAGSRSHERDVWGEYGHGCAVPRARGELTAHEPFTLSCSRVTVQQPGDISDGFRVRLFVSIAVRIVLY